MTSSPMDDPAAEASPSGIERVDGGKSGAHETTPAPVAGQAADDDARQRQEEILDEAIEETFPASDPIAPSQIS